jgi:hypothetical protein
MCLVIIEGARSSGKSYLISQQQELPVFKFDFNTNFSYWEFKKDSTELHWFGLGKEIMLHELKISLGLPKMIIDRGILTNSVWGVLQKRISVRQAKKDLHNFNERGFFKGNKIVLINGNHKRPEGKDVWGDSRERILEEKYLFDMFFDFLQGIGVDIIKFENNIDNDSVNKFKNLIKKI